MSYEKTIRALSGHFEGRAMSYEKTIRALSLDFEGTAKSYEKTIIALSVHFEGTAKSYEKMIRELSMHFEGRYVVSTPYLCNTAWVYSEYLEYKKNSPKLKRSFRLAQLLVPFFESITEQVISEDLLAVHLEIEGSNDMSSESDPFLAPTYESEDSIDDVEVNEQGEWINVVIEPVNVPSPVNVPLLDENMPLTTTTTPLLVVNVEGGIASGRPQVEPEIRNVLLSISLVGLFRSILSSEPVRLRSDKEYALPYSFFTWFLAREIGHVLTCSFFKIFEPLKDVVGILLTGLLSKSLSLSWKRNQRKLSCFSFSVCLFLLRATLEMVVRKGHALSFDVVPLLGLLTVMEESRFIMRKGFAQDVSIAIGSTALTTAAAPLSQPNDLVKKRSETIEQAALISFDEAASSTGCHPQSPPPVVTIVESTGDCGIDVGPVKKKPDMDKQREIQAIKAGLPNKTCLHRGPGHSSLDVTPELLQPDYNVTAEYRKYQRKYPQKKKTSKETNALLTQLGATLPLVSDTVVVLGSREPVPRLQRRKRYRL
ncbi:hypothetical protein IFM89_013046 [Coptis chinensis]|uniref:Uncharacterized protein n=1 Tax=Coptis chinensis TaxID=261450 RepID=A0A835GZ43_9MAGN|nr:hypothetical protein IFM89_013046 [Coptis chinensis]